MAVVLLYGQPSSLILPGMEKCLANSLTKIAPCTKSLSDVVRAATAAKKAAATIPVLCKQFQSQLVGARLNRAESLMCIMCDCLKNFDSHVESLHHTTSVVIARPLSQSASWNCLSDQWYFDRATILLENLSAVKTARTSISNALDFHFDWSSKITELPSYADLVFKVYQAVSTLEIEWSQLLRNVDEWRDILIAVLDGIGESGSLIPMS